MSACGRQDEEAALMSGFVYYCSALNGYSPISADRWITEQLGLN
jgi:hypothetical protein